MNLKHIGYWIFANACKIYILAVKTTIPFSGKIFPSWSTEHGRKDCPYRRIKQKGWKKVKTGSSGMNARERQVRDAVQEARVSYEIFKLEGENGR
jgi:hypothetical protein